MWTRFLSRSIIKMYHDLQGPSCFTLIKNPVLHESLIRWHFERYVTLLLPQTFRIFVCKWRNKAKTIVKFLFKSYNYYSIASFIWSSISFIKKKKRIMHMRQWPSRTLCVCTHKLLLCSFLFSFLFFCLSLPTFIHNFDAPVPLFSLFLLISVFTSYFSRSATYVFK
jgi:hypothetical protein